MNLWNYIRTAFVNRWNLLFFLGGTAFSVISGHPDIILPLVLAGEAAYVGLLASNPRFHAYVDAQAAKAVREASTRSSEQSLSYILKALPKDLLKRFSDLRAQCLELRQIAMELKQPGMAASDVPLDQFQVAGLDRLLWIHLRLLYTEYSLSRFLEKTNKDRINSDIQQLEQRIKQLPANQDDPRWQRVRKALEDNLETSRTRLANLTKAGENCQLVHLEIERLENKIRSLCEMAVNRQEPEFISSEVDHVATSMLETERTMNELQFATGLADADDQTPELLQARTAKVLAN